MKPTFPKRLVVTVTKEDIEKAKPHESFFCPLARAMNRAFAGAKCEVFFTRADVCKNGDRVARYIITQRTYAFRDNFDHDSSRKKCKPGRYGFDLESIGPKVKVIRDDDSRFFYD